MSEPYWQALRDERIVLPRCLDCQQWFFYPRRRCPKCLSDRISWQPVDGRGVLYSYTVDRQPMLDSSTDRPALVAIVALPQGPHLTTTLIDVDPEDPGPSIGAPVEPVFDHGADGITLLRYRPAGPRP